MKYPLIRGVFLAGLLAMSLTASATATQVHHIKTVPEKTVTGANINKNNHQSFKLEENKDFKSPKKCKNWLVKELRKAGFKDRGLRVAWSIAMRESGGRADAISPTGDYGVFQFNKAAMGKLSWWNTDKLLTRNYNLKIAYRVSQKGKTFYPWDISGKGEHQARYTSSHVYAKYKSWYKKYPKACKQH